MVSHACMFGIELIRKLRTYADGGCLFKACYTYENINLNILNNIPLFGVNAFDASQNVFNIHALPSNPCL